MKYAILFLLIVLAACGGERLSPCQEAFQRAGNVNAYADDVNVLDPAIFACGDVSEWSLAASQFPDALDGVDAVTFLRNRCQYGGIQLSARPICKEATGS